MLPSVTWPSPPMATRSPRRTDRMVVPWNWEIESVIGNRYTGRSPLGDSEIHDFKRAISGGLPAHEDRVAIDPEGLEKCRVQLVQVGEDHALARQLDRLHHVEEGRRV